MAVLAMLALYINWCDKTFKEGAFRPELKTRFTTLVKYNNGVSVIVAGDSRAKSQVIPRLIERETGLKTVNIASNGQDLITLYNALKRHQPLYKNKTIMIISTSCFQIDDMATTPGEMSDASVLNMSLFEKLMIFRNNYSNLLPVYQYIFVKHLLSDSARLTEEVGTPDWSLLQDQGFTPLTGHMKPVKKTAGNAGSVFDQKNSSTGARWRIFQQALAGLSRFNTSIHIYQPPVSPAWREHIKGTPADASEREFSKKLQAEVSKYGNVRFLDFYNNDIKELGNDMYHDPTHLNSEGAKIFTGILSAKVFGVF